MSSAQGEPARAAQEPPVVVHLNNDISTPPVMPAVVTAQPPRQRIHVLQKGDTLIQLARQYYGDASAWRLILEANRDQVQDPNKVYVGQRLIIPE